jgi:hypothetical protein
VVRQQERLLVVGVVDAFGLIGPPRRAPPRVERHESADGNAIDPAAGELPLERFGAALRRPEQIRRREHFFRRHVGAHLQAVEPEPGGRRAVAGGAVDVHDAVDDVHAQPLFAGAQVAHDVAYLAHLLGRQRVADRVHAGQRLQRRKRFEQPMRIERGRTASRRHINPRALAPTRAIAGFQK